MSTSTERHVAEQYSGAKTDDGKLSIIIEMQQGMVRALPLLTPSHVIICNADRLVSPCPMAG